jgi:hypothetical protein
MCQSAGRDFDKAIAELDTKLDSAAAALLERYRAAVTVRVVLDNGPIHMLLTGPEEVVEHGAIELHNLPAALIARIRKDGSYRLDSAEIDRALRRTLLDPMLDDMVLQNWHSRFFGFRYLTDRPDDLAVLSAINSNTVESLNVKAQSALRHSLPVVDGLDTKALIRLRQTEGEAFIVYRDALNGVLREVEHNDAASIKQAFDDIVRPELHRLDKAVASARKLVRRSLRDSVLIGTGLVCIGVFGGFFVVAFWPEPFLWRVLLWRFMQSAKGLTRGTSAQTVATTQEVPG